MSIEFSSLDKRQYATVSVREGYGGWVATYERTVHDEMDLRLLDGLTSVQWDGVRRAIDLGCGTGRTGAWLQRRGVTRIDGIDLTSEMLRLAEQKDVYETLAMGDVLSTRLESAAYDLAIASLVDEHIRELPRFYQEASRLLCDGGFFALVGYHPQFIMTTGMPTHYPAPSGDAIAIETHVHLFSDHVHAARAAALSLVEMKEGLIDDGWVRKKPKWRHLAGHPISFAFVWRA